MLTPDARADLRAGRAKFADFAAVMRSFDLYGRLDKIRQHCLELHSKTLQLREDRMIMEQLIAAHKIGPAVFAYEVWERRLAQHRDGILADEYTAFLREMLVLFVRWSVAGRNNRAAAGRAIMSTYDARVEQPR